MSIAGIRAVSGLVTGRNLLVLAAVGLFLAWFVLLRPSFLGGPATYVMVGGESMEPTLHNRDLVVVREHDSYTRGDIVAFRVPQGEPGEGAIVIHRIVGGSPDEGLVMQGDNNEGLDPWRPAGDEIVGRMWFSLPGASPFVSVLQSPTLLAGVAASVAVLLVLSGGGQKKGPPQLSAAEPSHAIRRRRPRGLELWLLLILLSGIGTALPSTPRHQGGGRHS
jgi:signal peptidase